MGGREAGPLMIFLWLLPSCGEPDFICADDRGCSAFAGGRCEAGGRCSYPDDDCPSGRRFSKLSDAPNACVPEDDVATGPATATGTDGDGDGPGAGESSGGPDSDPTDPDTAGTSADPDPTSGVDLCADGCTGPGEGKCVVVDGEATCACEAGWYSEGQACLDDPCDEHECRFVDPDGDDNGDGTIEQPWATLDRAISALPNLRDGTHVLLKRGATFGLSPVSGTDDNGNSRRVANEISASGKAGMPVVLGAYGSLSEPRPVIADAFLEVDEAAWFTMRDLDIRCVDSILVNGNETKARCMFVGNTGHFTLQDSVLSGCSDGCLRVSDGSHHSTLFRNVFDAQGQVGGPVLTVSDMSWENILVGEHHWIAQNEVRGGTHRGIRVFFSNAHAVASIGDYKVVDNLAEGMSGEGIVVAAPGAWMLRNTVRNAGTELPDEQQPDGGAAMTANSDVFAEGNLIFGGVNGLRADATATVRRNTVVAQPETVRLVHARKSSVTAEHNLLVMGEAEFVVSRDHGEPRGPWADNAYVPGPSGCLFQVLPTEEVFPTTGAWERATGETGARCEAVPGIDLSGESVSGEDMAPDVGWWGCAEVGALECGDGEPRPLMFEPFPGLPENDGLGWAGPMVIRRRYGVDPS